MLYLANPSTPQVRDAMTRGAIGAIDTPAQGQPPPPGVPYGLDNGCYGAGFPGEDPWHRWLRDHPSDPSLCLWATAPDVVGDAEATWERSAPWLDRIRALGLPAALVAQNGIEHMPVPWDRFDVLFLGGDTRFKLGLDAARLTREAVTRGIPVHMGRVNSARRIRYAQRIGCATSDGTFIKWAPDANLARVERWLTELRQPVQEVLL